MQAIGFDPQEISAFIDKGAWLAAAALLIGLLARAAKSPRFFGGPFARVPRERRPYVIASLGLASGVLEALVRGVSWPRALAQGALSAGLAMLGHGLAGGVSPEKPAAPPAQGALPAPGPVVDTMLHDLPPGPRATEAAPATATPFTATWTTTGTPPLTVSVDGRSLQDLDFDDASRSGGPS